MVQYSSSRNPNTSIPFGSTEVYYHLSFYCFGLSANLVLDVFINLISNNSRDLFLSSGQRQLLVWEHSGEFSSLIGRSFRSWWRPERAHIMFVLLNTFVCAFHF